MVTVQDIARHIRDVPDFPKPGIVFKDITPLLLDPTAFRRAVELMTAPFRDARISRVVSIESRGRSEEHTSELQSHVNLVCRLLLEKKKKILSGTMTTNNAQTSYH